MHIIEQRNFLVLTNGEGSPRQRMLIQTALALPVLGAILMGPVSAAMHGWVWGWLSLLSVPALLLALGRVWFSRCHATLEIDRRDGRVRLERRFANRTIEERLAIGDITAIEVETTGRHDRQPVFAAVLALNSGRRVRLGPSRHDRAAFDRAKDAVRAIL